MIDTITAIIPARNAEVTIRRAVMSALEAGVHSVLVYDDFSTDRTPQILESLSSQFDEVEFYTAMPNMRAGVVFARNFLISLADDGLIIPLDADDELRSVLPLLDRWEYGTWVYGDNMEHCNGEIYKVKASPAGSLARKNITGVTFAFHRSDWERVGGYDPDFAYAEDYGFQCALTAAGVRPVYLDCIVYDRYLYTGGNERTALAGAYWEFYRNMARRKYPSVFVGT